MSIVALGVSIMTVDFAAYQEKTRRERESRNQQRGKSLKLPVIFIEDKELKKRQGEIEKHVRNVIALIGLAEPNNNIFKQKRDSIALIYISSTPQTKDNIEVDATQKKDWRLDKCLVQGIKLQDKTTEIYSIVVDSKIVRHPMLFHALIHASQHIADFTDPFDDASKTCPIAKEMPIMKQCLSRKEQLIQFLNKNKGLRKSTDHQGGINEILRVLNQTIRRDRGHIGKMNKHLENHNKKPHTDSEPTHTALEPERFFDIKMAPGKSPERTQLPLHNFHHRGGNRGNIVL